MDLSENSVSCSNPIMVGGPESGASCQAESGGTIVLQLLEFKAHLLEAVEELHIRRDAELRFENQINKVLLDKQEVEQEKKTLQHQIEAASNQHRLLQRQLQAKIRYMEEERGKNQQIGELKEKEIHILKEELNSLQLLKYNLEKKSSELEQKLVLQSRSKDSHLNQMGEVERRFTALSRQCAAVKQAHAELVHNVDEAMRINTKLTSVNEQQEVTIQSLKQEVEEVRNKLIKAKMSSGQQGKSHSPAHSDQHIQQLHHKLSMEAEMNKRLMDENEAVRAEKKEVMRSLQKTHQLLLSQTQTASRVEVDLRTKAEQHQALKREHEVMREKSKAMEDKVARLLEGYAASESTWDAERTRLLDSVRRAERDLQAVREAHEGLRREHAQLSTWAEVHAQHLEDLETRASRPSLSVSAGLLPPEGVKAFNEPDCSPAPWSSGSLQEDASPQITNPDGLEGNRTTATGATGGQETPNPYQASPCTEPSSHQLPNNLEVSAVICAASSPPADEAASTVRAIAAFSVDHKSNNASAGAPREREDEETSMVGQSCEEEGQPGRREEGGQDEDREEGEERGSPGRFNDHRGRGAMKPATDKKDGDEAGEEGGGTETEIQAQTGGDNGSNTPPVSDSSEPCDHSQGRDAVNHKPPPAPQKVQTNDGLLSGQVPERGRLMDESGCSWTVAAHADIQDLLAAQDPSDSSSILSDANADANQRSTFMKRLGDSEQASMEIPTTLSTSEAPQSDWKNLCADVVMESQAEPESRDGSFINGKQLNVEAPQASECDTECAMLGTGSSECFKQPLPKDRPPADKEESPLPGGSACMGSLDWQVVNRHMEIPTTADILHQFAQCATPSAASASSGVSGMTSLPNPPRYGLLPAAAAGWNPDAEMDPSSSQEREQQQASLRAQISRLEQFLTSETLHLPKRRRTDN